MTKHGFIAVIQLPQFIQDGIVERFEETSDVRPYYAMCSVYVLPSYREGTPRTVLCVIPQVFQGTSTLVTVAESSAVRLSRRAS